MKKILPAILGYLLFLILFTYPAVFHLSDKIIGDGGDNYQFLAFQHLAKQQFENGHFPFGWTNYWRYPVGFDFSTSYDSALLLIVGITLYQLISDPAIVYNISVLLFLFCDSFFSYLFFQKMTGNNLLGFLGGLIYGFSFYNIARMGGHPNLVLTGCFPFFFYALYQFWERQGDNKSFLFLTLSLILIYLTSLQYALIFVGGLLFLLPLAFVFYKEKVVSLVRLFLQKRWPSILTLLVIIVVFIFFNYTKVTSYFKHTFILPTAEIVSVPVINYILPNQYLRIFPGKLANDTKEWIEYAVFFGFIEIFLFILFIFSMCAKRRTKLFLVVAVAIFFLLALGDLNYPGSFMPYTILFRFLPFRGIIEPARFYIFIYLAMTLAILLFLKKFLADTGKVGIVLILLFLIFERLPANFYLSATAKDKNFLMYVSSSHATAVLDLPVFIDWWNGNKYDLYSIYYQKPIVNGYIHWSGNTDDSQSFVKKLKRFECSMDKNFEPRVFDENMAIEDIDLNQKLLDDLIGYGITTVVFHKDISLGEKQCQEAIERINFFLERSGIRFRTLFTDQDTSVYQLE